MNGYDKIFDPRWSYTTTTLFPYKGEKKMTLGIHLSRTWLECSWNRDTTFYWKIESLQGNEDVRKSKKSTAFFLTWASKRRCHCGVPFRRTERAQWFPSILFWYVPHRVPKILDVFVSHSRGFLTWGHQTRRVQLGGRFFPIHQASRGIFSRGTGAMQVGDNFPCCEFLYKRIDTARYVTM